MAVNPLAVQLIDAFEKDQNPSAYFPKLSRSAIAEGLRARVDNPNLINQGDTSLCGSAAVVTALAKTRVVDYVKAVIELYNFGAAEIRKMGSGSGNSWYIAPGKDVRNYKPSPKTAEVDWIIMASIRDSENWLLDYEKESNDASAITRGATVADWLRKAGYAEVIDKTNNVFSKDVEELQQAADLYKKDYQVCLLIDTNALNGKTSFISYPKHWVILASDIDYVPFMRMEVYSWGEKLILPKQKMELVSFVRYFYGFVAAKY